MAVGCKQSFCFGKNAVTTGFVVLCIYLVSGQDL